MTRREMDKKQKNLRKALKIVENILRDYYDNYWEIAESMGINPIKLKRKILDSGSMLHSIFDEVGNI